MAVLSMTGFGRATTEAEGRTFALEVRSVNHRGLDLKIRLRDPDAFVESEMNRAVRAVVERGSLFITVREEDAGTATRRLDEGAIRRIHASLERLRQELQITAQVDLLTVATFMGSGSSEGGSLRGEALWERLRPALEQALEALRAMRRKEGESLALDLRQRLAHLQTLRARLLVGAAPLAERFVRRMEERLAQMSTQVGLEPARLAQEVALLADRLDISEELVRLEAHLQHLGSLLDSPDGKGVGRKLEFVIQEIGRELNTTGSKAQDVGVVNLVIEAKAELEKIREQAQNIE